MNISKLTQVLLHLSINISSHALDHLLSVLTLLLNSLGQLLVFKMLLLNHGTNPTLCGLIAFDHSIMEVLGILHHFLSDVLEFLD